MSIVKNISLSNTHVYVYHSLPSGGARTLFESNIKFLKGKFKFVKIIEEKFIPTSFIHYYFYVLVISRIKAYLYNQTLKKTKNSILLVYHSWFIKSPYILRNSSIPTIYVCHEPPREFYDRQHIEEQSFKEKIINSIRLPIKWIDNINAKSANLIVANSKFSQSIIEKAYKRKSTLIYPGISEQKEHKYQKNNQVITVGALNKFKRELFFVDVVSNINEKDRPELVFIANGGDTKYIKLIISTAQQKNVKIRILENVSNSELFLELGRSKAFLYAPINEPFGLVVLEALSVGLPIISYKYGGGYVEILNEHNGKLVDNLNPKEWAIEIYKCITNTKKNIDKLKKMNISKAQYYSSHKMNLKLLKAINSIL